MKKDLSNFPSIYIAACLAISLLPCAASGGSSPAMQVEQQRVFATPVEWIGQTEPPASESQALLVALQSSGAGMKLDGLENFLAAHPDSAWSPSLNLNLAERLNGQGRHSLALA